MSELSELELIELEGSLYLCPDRECRYNDIRFTGTSPHVQAYCRKCGLHSSCAENEIEAARRWNLLSRDPWFRASADVPGNQPVKEPPKDGREFEAIVLVIEEEGFSRKRVTAKLKEYGWVMNFGFGYGDLLQERGEIFLYWRELDNGPEVG